MSGNRDLDFYFRTIVAEGLYSTEQNLRFHLDTVFEGVRFQDRAVLDIGGGTGILSFYACYRGAREVVCLEPEAEGSSSGMVERFHRLRSLLRCEGTVSLERVTFQNYDPKGKTFDLVVLYDSVNHLDEQACQTLTRSERSRRVYLDIFKKLHDCMNGGGKLVVADCSRFNFFSILRLKNPFVPTIDWKKHQSPRVWAELLEEAGFSRPRVRWTTFNRLGSWGRRLLGNPVAAFFLDSHFVLTMDRT
jgi:SAM-dependent methyltransferase